MMYMDNVAVVILHNVSKAYVVGRRKYMILRNVSAEFYRGESVGIHGPSGAGKTTLLRIIAGLERPDTGTVIVAGYDLSTLDEAGLSLLRNNIISYIPQDYGLVDDFTVYENVEIPLLIGGIRKEVRMKRIAEALSYVGIQEKERVKVRYLSGGEKQRVAIARALVTTPSVLLADEPTANLDYKNAMRVADVLKGISRDFGTTVIIVTHDQRILDLMDRCYTLIEGVLSPVSPPEALP